MDGKTLLRDLRQLLQEQASSTWLDDKTSYDYLYKAAVEFVSRTKINTSTQTITTVANQAGYRLNQDFLQPQLYNLNDEARPFVKYYDGTNYSFIYHRDYDPIILGNQTTAVTIPDNWTITDYAEESDITGTAAAASDETQDSYGEATLESSDATGSFTTYVTAGDTIYNVTDDSTGIVTSVTNATTLEAAMFGGTNNAFATGAVYRIYPQGKLKIVFDPKPSTSSHTVTVYYVQRPAPVYSAKGKYRIPVDYKQALIYYAAWMYKNRDREPNYAELENKYFEEQCRKAANQYGKALHRKGFRVNMIKRGVESGSWR